MELRVLTATEILQCLDMPTAIDLMSTAFEALSSHALESPLRTMIQNENGTILYKPAHWNDAQLFACKIVTVFPENPSIDLPATAGVVLANDAATGMPNALLEAGSITSLRTGAATGLATKLIADESARVAALFGVGGQAEHQLEALLAVRRLERVYVFSRSPESRVRFCQRCQPRNKVCELVATDDIGVLSQCEIIVTATTSPSPLFERTDLSDRVHINAVGSLGVNRSELDAHTIGDSRIFVDQREACMAEAGEFQLARRAGLLQESFRPTELGELILGTETVDDAPLTVFKSVGNAAQDIVCVRHILQQSAAMNLGTVIELG